VILNGMRLMQEKSSAG